MNAKLTTWNAAPHSTQFLNRLIGHGVLLLGIFLLVTGWGKAFAADPQPLNALQEINY